MGILLLRSVDYRVFEYAQAEFDECGAAILIALRIDASQGHRVLGYLHSNWIDAVGKTPSFDREYIEDFVYDLRQQDFMSSENVVRYFNNIEELSVGPLRTSRSGVHILDSLSESTKTLLEESRGVSNCSPDCFSRLIADLTSSVDDAGVSCLPVAGSN